jgi:hypothetical protein
VAGLSAINRGFNKVPERAEGRVSAQLRDTFVDSGVVAVMRLEQRHSADQHLHESLEYSLEL